MPTESEYAVCYCGMGNAISVDMTGTAEEAAARLAVLNVSGRSAFIIEIRRTWPAPRPDPQSFEAHGYHPITQEMTAQARSEAEGKTITPSANPKGDLDVDGFTKPRRTL